MRSGYTGRISATRARPAILPTHGVSPS